MKYRVFLSIAILFGTWLNIHAEFDESATYNTLFRMLNCGGPDGANGSCDINGWDMASTDFVRQLWNLNELPADEAICGWGDPGIPELVSNSYGDISPAHGLFARLHFGIFLANYYLEQTPATLTLQRAEVRFLRALFYFHALDLFGNVPFTTESEKTLFAYVGEYANNKGITINTEEEYNALKATFESNRPAQVGRTAIYEFIESELLAIDSDLPEPGAEVYARPSKAAAWLLLARLYLNAEVYTGTPQWSKAREYAGKICSSSAYQLCADYSHLFMGDNDANGAQREIILPVYADSEQATSYGSTMFLIASCYDGNMPPNGLSYATWAGNRARKALVEKFSNDDKRAMFYSDGHTLDISNIATFSNGYAVTKFTNVNADGTNPYTSFANTDFPLMRLAEAYLTYAEADAHLNGGTCSSMGATMMNTLRSRAGVANLSTVTLSDIADEWAREFYFEGRRRSDLVRLGLYTSDSYLWDWKGGEPDGKAIEDYRAVFPLPDEIMNMSEDYEQNPGYFDLNKMKLDATFTLDTPPYASATVDLAKYNAMQFTWTAPNVEGYDKDLIYLLEVSPTGKFLTSLDEGFSYDDMIGDFGAYTTYKQFGTFVGGTAGNILSSGLIRMLTSWKRLSQPSDLPVQPYDLYVRCRATISGDYRESFSNVVKITVVPYTDTPTGIADGTLTATPSGTIDLNGGDYYTMYNVCRTSPTELIEPRIVINGTSYSVVMEDGQVMMSYSDLKQAMTSTAVQAYVEGGVMSGGLSQLKRSNTFTLNFAEIEYDKYYFIGTLNGWDPYSTAYPLQTADGIVYTIDIPGPASASDGWFKIAFADAPYNGWGAQFIMAQEDGCADMEGYFITGGSNDGGAWHLPVLGEGYDHYHLTFNLNTWRFTFTPETATGIKISGESDNSSSFISHPSAIYDLQGRKGDGKKPGIYIIGGKKIAIK